MKKRIVLLFILVYALTLAGCSSANNELTTPDPTTAPSETHAIGQGVSVSEDISYGIPDLMMFTDIERFNDYLLSAEEEDTADLNSLERYYLPSGIPEEYQLYKITPGSSDIGFWYLPKQNQTSPGAILDAESQLKHFLFLMMRDGYDLDTVLAQYGASDDDQQDGRCLIQRERENIVIWEEDGSVLMLYLPEGYEVTDLDVLCQVEEYGRSKDMSTFEIIQH